MKALIAKLVWPAYFAGLIFLSYTGFTSYQNATSILEDHTVVEAQTELVNTSSRTKRGHTSTTYNFRYSYTVDGTDYTGKHSAVNKKAQRYLDDGTVSIAYSNDDPAQAGLLHALQGQSSLARWIKSILIAALVLGILALFVYGWALPDEEEEPEVQDSASAKA
jgi:hypothetical protein